MTVTGLTTPTSLTTANPDGTLTVSQMLQPVRAWRDGRWTALNPDLRRGRDGTVSPAATSNGLTLSGGGNSTLAVMTADARTLTLSWSGTLPTPTLSGSTATYANVLPGVDLVVTADDQGGFTDTLVVHTAAAAANPALASLSLGLATSGLTLSTDAAGDLSAAIGPDDPAMITTQAPQIWDSTPPPAGMPTVTEPGGLVVNANNGLPAYSSATAPGSAAHVASVPVNLSGGTLTLSPPSSVLTGPGVTYPVFIDPTWHNFASSQVSAWTQVDSGFPTQNYWHESSDLQSGDCYDSPPGSCQGMGKALSFIRMPIPSVLHPSTDIDAAELYMTEDWAPSCTPTSVRLYTTGDISSGTTWDNQPPWSSGYRYQNAAFGHPGCGYYKNDITWDVTSTIAAVVGNQTTQTFGLRAADESDTGQWKKFWSGNSNITLSVTYNYPPNTPSNLSTSPGGDCHTSSSDPAQIGDDDVTFSAYASDNDGDNDLSTDYVIDNPNSSTVYDSAKANSNVVTGDNTDARLTLPQDTIQGFNTNGKTIPYTYYWQAQTTDDFNLTSGWSAKCWFTYNPTGPQTPTITSTGPFTLGQPARFTFTAPSGCSPTTSPCPVSYTYQLGSSSPFTVTNLTDGNWTGSITINRKGPLLLSVYATSAGGNPGEIAYFPLTASEPANPYPDGYFDGGPYPDLLTTGTGTTPSAWLLTGSGNGTLNGPLDIGSLGTGINPGSDGPADWAGAQILHGDFTGDGVQDVMAYYPQGTTNPAVTPGTGVMIGGTGDQSPLVSTPDNTYVVTPSELTDQNLCDPGCPSPTDLVAASNASQIGTGVNDLIGILGNSSSGYELALFTSGSCSECAIPGQYALDTTLSTAAPGGDSWQNYALATAQPGCYPGSTTTCNQGNVMLFALDTSTGKLWDTTTANGGIGSWTAVTTSWGSNAPALLSADINAAGQTELWTQTGTGTSATITSYTLTGATLSQESSHLLNDPLGEWPLTDGSPLAKTSSATTAADTIAGNTATLAGSATWGTDDYFSTDVDQNSQPGYLVPPADTIPSNINPPKISLWFKTTTPNQVLVSLQDDPMSLTPGAYTTKGYDPVLYIGQDGHLCAEWWNSKIDPAESSAPVDDGLWHHAILTMYASSQTLYLDGNTVDNFPGQFTGGTANLTFGGGYIGGNWPDETHYQQNGNDGYPEYFDGQLADIVYSYPGGP